MTRTLGSYFYWFQGGGSSSSSSNGSRASSSTRSDNSDDNFNLQTRARLHAGVQASKTKPNRKIIETIEPDMRPRGLDELQQCFWIEQNLKRADEQLGHCAERLDGMLASATCIRCDLEAIQAHLKALKEKGAAQRLRRRLEREETHKKMVEKTTTTTAAAAKSLGGDRPPLELTLPRKKQGEGTLRDTAHGYDDVSPTSKVVDDRVPVDKRAIKPKTQEKKEQVTDPGLLSPPDTPPGPPAAEKAKAILPAPPNTDQDARPASYQVEEQGHDNSAAAVLPSSSDPSKLKPPPSPPAKADQSPPPTPSRRPPQQQQQQPAPPPTPPASTTGEEDVSSSLSSPRRPLPGKLDRARTAELFGGGGGTVLPLAKKMEPKVAAEDKTVTPASRRLAGGAEAPVLRRLKSSGALGTTTTTMQQQQQQPLPMTVGKSNKVQERIQFFSKMQKA